MATLEDIAKRAGVTPKTVSNVLSGRYKAERSDAARRAVQIRKIAAQLGYRVNSAARATRTGRTGLVGVLSSRQLTFSVHAPVFEQALLEHLHDRNICLVKDILDEPTDAPEYELPRIVRERTVDGLLINYAFNTPPAIAKMLDRCRIPAVWINRKRDWNCVHPADEGAAYEATMHLIRHGHRRILYSGGVRNGLPDDAIHYSLHDRCAGYERAMREAGLVPSFAAPDLAREQEGRVLPPGVRYRHLQRMLANEDRPTAVFSNGEGRTVVAAAMSLGVRVPEDLSVVAIDNDASAGSRLPVDRMIVPYRSMACAAAEELYALIQRPRARRRPVVLPFECDLMGTVAPPRR